MAIWPWSILEYPSSEMFKNQEDKALSNLVQANPVLEEERLHQMISRGPFQSKYILWF